MSLHPRGHRLAPQQIHPCSLSARTALSHSPHLRQRRHPQTRQLTLNSRHTTHGNRRRSGSATPNSPVGRAGARRTHKDRPCRAGLESSCGIRRT